MPPVRVLRPDNTGVCPWCVCVVVVVGGLNYSSGEKNSCFFQRVIKGDYQEIGGDL